MTDSENRPLLSVVETALKEREWNYNLDEERGSVTFSVGAKHTGYACLAIAEEEMEVLLIYFRVDFRAPEEKRAAVGEALTRANYGLRIGNFEMDFSDGEVRYKCSVDVEGGRLGATMVNNMISAGISTFERYYPALMKVIHAGADPAEAIAEVES